MTCRGHVRAATRPPPQRRSTPIIRSTSSRTSYRSRRRFFVFAHSLRRSSFQNQNRTAAFGLVDNFGLSLCWVLILFRMGLLFFYSEGVERERE